MHHSEPVDINQEDAALLRNLVAIWSGLFAVGAVLYAVVAYLCWPV